MVRKFLKKERKKALPAGAKYWGFDCKFGESEETAVELHLSSLTKSIDALVEKSIMTIYVELTPKALEGGGTPFVPPLELIEEPVAEIVEEPVAEIVEETVEEPAEDQVEEPAPEQPVPSKTAQTKAQTTKSIWPEHPKQTKQED